jgi:hypothetical protein
MAPFFLCLNKTFTLHVGTFGALKNIKNGMQLRKLWPLKVEGVKNSKKQTTKCYKG